MTSPARSTAPYGPATPLVRQFLVRLSALDLAAHDAVVERFAELGASSAFLAADAQLATLIEGSGRADARDALFGPLLQLVRLPDASPSSSAAQLDGVDRAAGADAERPVAVSDADDEAPVPLDPIAEPAMAALLGLLVRDLLAPDLFVVLYAAFEVAIPFASLSSAG